MINNIILEIRVKNYLFVSLLNKWVINNLSHEAFYLKLKNVHFSLLSFVGWLDVLLYIYYIYALLALI